MANTLQVDGLVRISGLTPAPYRTYPQPLKDIPPRLIIYVVGGGETKVTVRNLVVRNHELPANKVTLLKGGPEPFEKEIHEILGSKSEDRFSNPFFEVVQKTCQVRFSYLLQHCNLCKGPRTLRKFPQKCQKIAGC